MKGMGTNIKERLKEYKKRYYQNILLRSSIFSILWLTLAFYLVNGIEFIVRFDTTGRGLLFFSFLAVFAWILVKGIFIPAIRLLDNKRQISDEEAALQIGKYFPEVKDKLLNVLQLSSISGASSDLIKAGIEQKTRDLSIVSFASAIDLKANLRYLNYLALPVGGLIIILLAFPGFVTESTSRIVQYNKEFLPEAPFRFVLLNSELKAFKNERFHLQVNLEGMAIPDQAYLIVNDRRIKLKSVANGTFEHSFNQVQDNFNFKIEAAGFVSQNYHLEVIRRPSLGSMDVSLNYPKYLGRSDESFRNSGNLQIPEGTEVYWKIEAPDTDQLLINFKSDNEVIKAEKTGRQSFSFQRQIRNSEFYALELKNDNSINQEPIQYRINVIKDQFPSLNIRQFQDTILYSYIIFGGSIADDYGLTELNLWYRTEDGDKFNRVNLPLLSNRKEQNIYYEFMTDSLNLSNGERLEYYLEVYDNDGVNGRKQSKTPNYYMHIPNKEEISEKLDRAAEGAKKSIDDAAQQAKDINESLNEIERRLKGKPNLDWQDEKLINELFNKREKLENEIEKMKQSAVENEQLMERFGSQNEKLREKLDMIQKLMDEIMDEETRKLYEELQKLLQENKNINQVQSLLDQINKKEDNLEKELDRTLELFKRWKYEMKMDEAIEKLNALSEEQEKLNEETAKENKSNEELLEKQEELKEKFEKLKEEMDEMREMNEQLKNPDNLEDTKEQEESIQKELEKSIEELHKDNPKQSGKSQQNAAKQMAELKEQLEQMQASAEMEMDMENLEQLRNILDNMIRLSFEQEDLLKKFREVQSNDPRFMELAKVQLELKDNSKVLQDSLESLSLRMFQLSSFITRELGDLNSNFDGALDALKERRKNQAIGKQEFAMTSINNLALMLDQLLQQLQDQMNNASGSGKSKKNNPSRDMSKLQEQLSQQIQQLKESGKQGKELSEELAKMAAEQERLRRMMQEMGQQTVDPELAQEIREIMEEMEKNEIDLVNKNLSNELIERQKKLTTRMLEAENAMKEEGMEQEREAEQAAPYEKQIPKLFDEYLKAKEKEIELLRTIPPKLNPYFKQEVNEYFKRINR
jgi:hypothetical protein